MQPQSQKNTQDMQNSSDMKNQETSEKNLDEEKDKQEPSTSEEYDPELVPVFGEATVAGFLTGIKTKEGRKETVWVPGTSFREVFRLNGIGA